MFSTNNFIILADKESLFVAHGDGQFLHLKRPMLRQWNFTVHHNPIEISFFGSDRREFVQGRQTFDLDLSLTGEGCELTSEDPQRKILETYTVLDLMKAVNRKLK